MSTEYVYTTVDWNDGNDVSLYRYEKSTYDMLMDLDTKYEITFSYYEDGSWNDINLKTTITSREQLISYEEVIKIIVQLELER